jgi:superfamily I DNA/RNA helicase
MRLLRNLEASGIPTTWVSQDVRSKEMYDITTDRVSLISIHSSKGLDFDLIYLVGVDRIRPPDETKQNLISLVYVAMTRAKYRLVILYVEETELISRMKECLPTEV